MADPNLGRMTLFVGGEVAHTTNIRRSIGFGVEGIGSSGELLLATPRSPVGFEEEWSPGHMARLDMETGAVNTVASYDFRPRTPPELEWDPIAPVGDCHGRRRALCLYTIRPPAYLCEKCGLASPDFSHP